MKPQCQTVYIQITGNKKGYKGFLVFLTTLLNGNMWKLMGGKKKKSIKLIFITCGLIFQKLWEKHYKSRCEKLTFSVLTEILI